MQMIAFSYPTLAVSTIYCIWLAYRRAVLQRERDLRERVAYMLWIIANRMSTESTPNGNSSCSSFNSQLKENKSWNIR
jgi:hypothetical protein